uniref:Uncharacterized protein n=1 Tax=Ananas comosus var. bracteatus TaxID=296719 RepID=A0A6V7NT01_ANACO|nr:unnamed protein product [Ananas comosus var. bracteatus]
MASRPPSSLFQPASSSRAFLYGCELLKNCYYEEAVQQPRSKRCLGLICVPGRYEPHGEYRYCIARVTVLGPGTGTASRGYQYPAVCLLDRGSGLRVRSRGTGTPARIPGARSLVDNFVRRNERVRSASDGFDLTEMGELPLCLPYDFKT